VQLLIGAVRHSVQFIGRIRALFEIINGKRSIETTRDNIRVLLIKIQSGNGLALFLNLKHAFTVAQVPNFDDPVVISRNQYLVVSKPDSINRVIMGFSNAMGYFARSVDKSQPLIFSAGGQN
jgi:hypothetical protein